MDALSSPTNALLSKGEHTGSGNEGECRTTNDVFNEVWRDDGLLRMDLHIRHIHVHRQGDIPLRSKAGHHVWDCQFISSVSPSAIDDR